MTARIGARSQSFASADLKHTATRTTFVPWAMTVAVTRTASPTHRFTDSSPQSTRGWTSSTRIEDGMR